MGDVVEAGVTRGEFPLTKGFPKVSSGFGTVLERAETPSEPPLARPSFL